MFSERISFLDRTTLWFEPLFAAVCAPLWPHTGRFNGVRRHSGLDLRRRNGRGQQIAHAHQVVGRARPHQDPIHLQRSAMPDLVQQRHRLQPAKTFFNALAFLLAEGVARLSGRSTIDSAAASSPPVLGHVRRDVKMKQVSCGRVTNREVSASLRHFV